MSARTRRVMLLGILAIAWLVTVACNGVSVVSTSATPEEAASLPTSTLAPTLAPTRTPAPTATMIPTIAPTDEPTSAPSPTTAPAITPESSTIPAESGVEFSITVTEKEINESFSLAGFEMEGVDIQNPVITLEEGRIVGDFTLVYEPMSIVADVSLYGTAIVVDGALYYDVTDVRVSESASFLVRLVVGPLIQQAIDQYSGDAGIPVPLPVLERVELLDVVMSPGELTISARTR